MAGRSWKNCGLKMPKRFADMTEEEMDYVGGGPWAVAGWVFVFLTYASWVGAMVTGLLWGVSGSSKMKKAFYCCLIATVGCGMLTAVCFSIDRCILARNNVVPDDQVQPGFNRNDYVNGDQVLINNVLIEIH